MMTNGKNNFNNKIEIKWLHKEDRLLFRFY